MKLYDLDRLIHSSHISFNAARKETDSLIGGQKPSIRTGKPITRDLSAHNLENISFYGVSFSGVRFGTVSHVIFNDCTFTDCDFGPSEKDSADTPDGMLDVLFFECTFDGGAFDAQTLIKCSIIEPNILNPPSFVQTLLGEKFVYSQAKVNFDFLNSIVDADTTPRSIPVLGESQFPKLTWEQVRFVSRLPFLQVSFLGMISLAILAMLVANVEEPFEAVFKECTERLVRTTISMPALSEFCDSIRTYTLTGGLLGTLKMMFLNFCILFAGAFIQTLKCPNEVLEFSRAYWTRQLRRPSVFYSALANRNRSWLWAAVILQAGSVLFFAYKAIFSFFRTFS